MATPRTPGGISLTNYVAFESAWTNGSRIGHFDLDTKTIQPLAFEAGTPIVNLYQVIEVGEERIIAHGAPLPADSVKILPPIYGRDILCVGKNYAEHAKEFNSSGFDSSDKVDQPSHPVIFTKRFTSIIANGEVIYPHSSFTQTLDFEGEVGVIIKKAGFQIAEKDAWDYVWGFTIINDVTARERQRDHKQFYIGKSADTFCPMGPIAVPIGRIGRKLGLQTFINGELRQSASTDDLIFSIPSLIQTLSEGQTILPGDVIATGTPAGVGIGRDPPVYLKPHDTISITVTGLGTLTNVVGSLAIDNPIPAKYQALSSLSSNNADKTPNSHSLTLVDGKRLNYKRMGAATGRPVVFVHGLGGSVDFWLPFIHSLKLEHEYALHLFDLEGHGLSPTSPLSKLSIASFAKDLDGIFRFAGVESNATVVAHSMGSLVAAQFALDNPAKVDKLILLGLPPSPLPTNVAADLLQRADLARTQGMAALVDAIAEIGTSELTKSNNPLGVAAIRLSLLGQDPEGYAKACTALAQSSLTAIDFSKMQAQVLLITGSEDRDASPAAIEKVSSDLKHGAGVKILEGIGHWHVFEDVQRTTHAARDFLS